MIVKSNRRLKVWSITINAASLEKGNLGEVFPLDSLKGCLHKVSSKFIVGLEKGTETGREHYQIYVNLDQKTQTPMKRIFPNVSDEVRKLITFSPVGDRLAMKDYARKDGLFYDSTCPHSSYYKDLVLRPLQEEIYETIKHYNDRQIFLFSDSVGNNGKTEFIKYLHHRESVIIAPCCGTVASMCYSIVSSATNVIMSGGTDVTYVLVDITRTSKVLQKEALSELFSVLEGLISGLVVASFSGKTKSVITKPGIFIPVVFTNANFNSFADACSFDRKAWYKIKEESDKPVRLYKEVIKKYGKQEEGLSLDFTSF